MSGFEPAVPVDGRHKPKLVLAPGQHIPRDAFIVRPAFRLECQGVAELFCSQRKGQGNAVLRVAIDTVGIDLFHQVRNGVGQSAVGWRACPDPTSSWETAHCTPRRWKSATILCGCPRYLRAWSAPCRAGCDHRCPCWGKSPTPARHRCRHSAFSRSSRYRSTVYLLATGS